jgi:hypothetical protein
MHAEAPVESIPMCLNGGELVGGNPFFRRYPIVIRKTPSFRPGTLAGLAADAERTVVQDGLSHNKTLNSVLSEFQPKV